MAAQPTTTSRLSLVEKIPLLIEKSGPRDAGWEKRLQEEYTALIQVRYSISFCLLRFFVSNLAFILFAVFCLPFDV
jgi:hypothetical protein